MLEIIDKDNKKKDSERIAAFNGKEYDDLMRRKSEKIVYSVVLSIKANESLPEAQSSPSTLAVASTKKSGPR